MKGYIVKNESKKVQKYLFGKGYEWYETFTRNTHEYYEMRIGKVCSIIVLTDDRHLDYYKVNTSFTFKKISKNIKIFVDVDRKLRI